MATAVDDGGSRIGKVLEQLEAHKTLLSSCTKTWKRLFARFASLDQSISQKSHSLDSKIQALDTDTFQTLETLDQRDHSIPDRESAAVARVQELKQAALAEFDKQPPSGDATFADVLRSHCRRMDSAAVWKFLVAKRKDLGALKAEIAPAVDDAVDSATLVLDLVEEFLSQKDGKSGVSDLRWACGFLLREVFPLGGPPPGVAGSVSERAAKVAEKWKQKFDGNEGGGVGPAEAQMFLQFVAGYRIRSGVGEDFLRSLVMKFPTRKGMAKLATALGMEENIEDMINEMINNGKELDAIYFAHDSGLTQKFSPIPLIKTYLKNVRKNANTVLKDGHYSMSASEEAGNLEFNAIRSIIKCVEEHKLESQFTLDSLRKRLSQLDRVKADKKRTAPSIKSQNKRARASRRGDVGFSPAKMGRPRWETPPHPHPPAPGGYAPVYNYPGQAVYESPAAPPLFASPYGGQGQGPVPPPAHHNYMAEDMTGARSSAPYAGPPSHGGYDYGAAPPSYSHTQPSHLQ